MSWRRRKRFLAAQLVANGFQPASVLEALGLPEIAHTGLPSVQVQAPENVTEEVIDEEQAE